MEHKRSFGSSDASNDDSNNYVFFPCAFSDPKPKTLYTKNLVMIVYLGKSNAHCSMYPIPLDLECDTPFYLIVILMMES